MPKHHIETIKDKYSKARGGYSRLLALNCAKCRHPMTAYQKDGDEPLLRLYLDRIHDTKIQSEFEIDKKLICSRCGQLLGLGYIYEEENRPAYKLFQDAVYTEALAQEKSADTSNIKSANITNDISMYGVVDKEELAENAKKAKAKGEKIIMTNGCFDILHPGHIKYLAQAKSFGDRLVIAVNDDLSIRRLKGEGRPINCLEDRMAVLAGLASVDWVVPFSTEEELEKLICEIVVPQALVKGGDYCNRPLECITGAARLVSMGGEMKFANLIDGRSTTKTIEKIRKV